MIHMNDQSCPPSGARGLHWPLWGRVTIHGQEIVMTKKVDPKKAKAAKKPNLGQMRDVVADANAAAGGAEAGVAPVLDEAAAAKVAADVPIA
jgi:hypothetical protein